MTIVKKISTNALGTFGVFSSRNKDDPFLYYNFNSDYESLLAAVDLRSMTDVGKISLGSRSWIRGNAAVSADGTVMYASDYSFASFQMTSAWSAEKPIFEQIPIDDRDREDNCIPDPFDNYTAIGYGVYPKYLNLTAVGDFNTIQPILKLDFAPACFATSQPLVFGFPRVRNDDDDWSFDSKATPKAVTAVQYGSFDSTNVDLMVPDGLLSPVNVAVPRGVGNSSDFKRVA